MTRGVGLPDFDVEIKGRLKMLSSANKLDGEDLQRLMVGLGYLYELPTGREAYTVSSTVKLPPTRADI